jgi:predicted nucleotidyltransferase
MAGPCTISAMPGKSNSILSIPGYTTRMATATVVRKIEEFRRTWRPTEEKVDLAVKTAIEIAQPSRIFVFGSWARGEAGIDSDLDLAVLLPDARKQEIGTLRIQLRQAFRRIPMCIDLIVASEGYATEFLNSINSVYYRILHEGHLAYDAARQADQNLTHQSR